MLECLLWKKDLIFYKKKNVNWKEHTRKVGMKLQTAVWLISMNEMITKFMKLRNYPDKKITCYKIIDVEILNLYYQVYTNFHF